MPEAKSYRYSMKIYKYSMRMGFTLFTVSESKRLRMRKG